MFLQNKYTIWYYSIIEKASMKNYTGYTEIHHIIPKSLGGADCQENIIVLSAKEHYICHLLLVRMTTSVDKKKMVFALHKISYSSSANQKRKIKSGREFHIVRSIVSKAFTGAGNPMYGKTRTPEERKKISIGTIKGMQSPDAKVRTLTIEGREAQRNGRLGWSPSESTRKEWSRKRKGRPGNPNINKGKKWFTDGSNNVLSKIQPVGYKPGRTIKSPCKL